MTLSRRAALAGAAAFAVATKLPSSADLASVGVSRDVGDRAARYCGNRQRFSHEKSRLRARLINNDVVMGR